jgi:hypothetical protein
MSFGTQRIFALCGSISMLMALAGHLIAGLVPPPSPTASAEQIAALYRENGHSIAMGGILYLLSTAPFVLFIGVLSVQIRRIAGDGRTYAYVQLAAGTASMLPVILVPVIWCTAAFRPEQSSEVIQALNDLAWITAIMITPLATAQVLAIGLGVLADKGARPIFPRWLGYVSVVIAILCLPGVLCVVTRTGPLAWDGIIAGGLPPLALFSWTIVMGVMLLRAIRLQESDAQVKGGVLAAAAL